MISPGIILRKAGPEDLPALQSFVAGLSTAARAARFFVPVAELPPMLAAALRTGNPLHHFLLARAGTTRAGDAAAGASTGASSGTSTGASFGESFGVKAPEGPVVALAQYARERAPAAACEIAVVIADAWQGHGIGGLLLRRLLADAERQGLTLATGEVLRQNRAMLALARSLGFSLQRHPDDSTLVQVVRAIRQPASPPRPRPVFERAEAAAGLVAA